MKINRRFSTVSLFFIIFLKKKKDFIVRTEHLGNIHKFHARTGTYTQNDISIQALGSTPNQLHAFTTMHSYIPVFSMLNKHHV
jgi:hypothetical protein